MYFTSFETRFYPVTFNNVVKYHLMYLRSWTSILYGLIYFHEQRGVVLLPLRLINVFQVAFVLCMRDPDDYPFQK